MPFTDEVSAETSSMSAIDIRQSAGNDELYLYRDTSGKKLTNFFILTGITGGNRSTRSFMSDNSRDITQLLIELRDGSQEAYDRLFSLLYRELHHIAWREISGEPGVHTYSKTDLVHEVYLKLSGRESLDLKNQQHFFAVCSKAMRQILIDYARKRTRKKRGGSDRPSTYIDELVRADHEADELIQIDSALTRLSEFDKRLADIVEMHYFGEMNFEDIADVMGLSERTVYRDWAKARAWLYKELKRKE